MSSTMFDTVIPKTTFSKTRDIINNFEEFKHSMLEQTQSELIQEYIIKGLDKEFISSRVIATLLHNIHSDPDNKKLQLEAVTELLKMIVDYYGA